MKKLMLVIAAVLVVCLLVPVSCAAPSSEQAMPAPPPTPAPEVIIEVPPRAPDEVYVYKEAGAGALPATEEERMIVRTGDISLIVEDVVDSRDEIAQLAVRFDGYVVSSRIRGEEQDMRGWISIRVPDASFDQALSELRSLAVRVDSESTNSQDVTEEYVDLQSRLRNAEA